MSYSSFCSYDVSIVRPDKNAVARSEGISKLLIKTNVMRGSQKGRVLIYRAEFGKELAPADAHEPAMGSTKSIFLKVQSEVDSSHSQSPDLSAMESRTLPDSK